MGIRPARHSPSLDAITGKTKIHEDAMYIKTRTISADRVEENVSVLIHFTCVVT